MERLLLLGLNHTTAPLEVREALAFTEEQQRAAVAQLKSRFPHAEFVLLSTCNRVELYLARPVHSNPRTEEIAGFLAEFHSVPAERFSAHLYDKSQRDVVQHLFNVVSSLDSMVLGETQILGQVRHAYDAARELAAAGSMLNPLFQRALAVGKQVMHETAIGEGRVSVASVAIDYARRIFDRFSDKTVLSIGAGKMSRLLLKHVAELRVGRTLVCNRDLSKAQALTAEIGGEVVPFPELSRHLPAADIVVSSTAAPRPIIGRDQMEQVLHARRYKPMLLIDIAVPRDIESSVGELDHVYLCNIDDLQRVVTQTQSSRTGEIAAARRLIDASVDEFVLWQRTRRMGPLIDELYSRYHALAQEELARTLNKLPGVGQREREQLEDLTRRIVNKLLHDPVQTLRESENPHLPAGPYLHALTKLFRLSAADEVPGAADESL